MQPRPRSRRRCAHRAAALRTASAIAGSASGNESSHGGPTPSLRLWLSCIALRHHASLRSSPTGAFEGVGTDGYARGGSYGNITQRLAEGRLRLGRDVGDDGLCARRGHDQGRHSPFAVGHDGDQRDDSQGRDADADRRAQREGRAARQESRAGRRRSGVELAVVRGEGPGTAHQGQGRGRVRMLDFGVAQIRPAGVRGVERASVLPARI